MYVPPAFAETDRARLFDFVAAHSFGLLVSNTDARGELVASHLPLLVERDAVPGGRLVGHMARANPQWRTIDGCQVLCVFSGPHAYVSPTWYEAEDVVPTWNYVAVHVYGTCGIIDDDEATRRIVARYVETYERSLPVPWQLDQGTRYFEKLVKLIVGFQIDVERIEGKWKLGQNHSVERREKAAGHLAARNDVNSQEIARLMRETIA